jgi:hypothetical protein
MCIWRQASVFGLFHSSKTTILLEGLNALYDSFVKCLGNQITKKMKVIVSSMYLIRVIVPFLTNTKKNIYLAGKMNQVIERMLSYGTLYWQYYHCKKINVGTSFEYDWC